MIDPNVQHLLENAIDSTVKLHIVLIFHEHPQLEVTPSYMVERCCRDIWSVAQALHELAEDGVLQAIPGGKDTEPHYWYAPRSDYLEPIRHLILEYDDPLAREKLYRSLRDLAPYAAFRRTPTWEYQGAIA